MGRKMVATFLYSTPILLTAYGLAGVRQAQDSKAPYSRMAPIAQYLMDESAEIALARSAAPPSISGDATIMVLKQNGYETVVKGKNGFVCIVERSWMAPFDWPEFWNPKMRGPACFNPPAVRSVLPFTYKRTDMILDGIPKTQVRERLKQAVAEKEVPAVEAGSMCYMMSRDQNLGDSNGHWHPHLMFYGPRSDSGDMGNDLPGSPVLLNPQFQNSPEGLTTYMVEVQRWSDGAPIH